MQRRFPPGHDAIAAMERGDTAHALKACHLLESAAGERPPAPAFLHRLGDAFRSLLRRRGYFVSDPKDFSGSLEEIYGIGEGFDLFDLASILARLDLRDHPDPEEDQILSGLRQSSFVRPSSGGPPLIRERRTP
jgi:hypothetical protein